MGYIQYVNIKQGTDSVNRFSNGNTLPLVQRPFGFAAPIRSATDVRILSNAVIASIPV